MDYNELKIIATTKKFKIQEIASDLEMTADGFRSSIKNETIELRKLKKLCDLLRINPILFFDVVPGTYINTSGHGQGNKIIESKEREIELLKQQIADKNEIIRLLREVNSRKNTGYGFVAEGE